MSNTDADLLKRLREIDENENTKFASAHEDDEADDDPCWDGYKQVGMKTKDGEKVPDCVPEEEAKTASTEEGQDALNEIAALLSKSAEDDDSDDDDDSDKESDDDSDKESDDDSDKESDDDSDGDSDDLPDQFKKKAFSKKAFSIEAEILESVVKTAGAQHIADSADKLAEIRRNLYS